jgi:type II secretory pathway component GspD/PulD (secretin)
MKRIFIITLISLVIPLLCLAQQPVMVTRTFDVLPSVNERISAAAQEGGHTIERGAAILSQSEEDMRERERRDWNDWKEFFQTMGVKWPEGSSLKYIPSIGKIVVTNTEENMRKFEEVLSTLNVIPYQVEVEAQFVEYKRADIDALAKQGGVTQPALMNLWQKGQAELLYAPKVVTQSGQEATAKGVIEVIYPTELGFDSDTGSATNANVSTNSGSSAVTPGGFETREVGVILKVMPEVSVEGTVITLQLTPEIVEEPIWKTYKGAFVDKDGKQQQVEIEEPFFFTQSFCTSISVKSGKTIMAGGGMMKQTKDKMVYCFVTAWLVDLEGKPIKTPDLPSSKPQN